METVIISVWSNNHFYDRTDVKDALSVTADEFGKMRYKVLPDAVTSASCISISRQTLRGLWAAFFLVLVVFATALPLLGLLR
jgi:hypothetical protein